MKRTHFITALLLACLSTSAFAADYNTDTESARKEKTVASADSKKEKKPKKHVTYNEKGEVIKTGHNFGPLPIVAFDNDKGFQFGALLNIFNFGDGKTYPNPYSTWYFEASAFHRGSQLYCISYDDKKLIPGVRLCSALRYNYDSGMEFFGFNGYQTNYDDSWKDDKMNGFYRYKAHKFNFKLDFVGNITRNFYWEAGFHFNYLKSLPFKASKKHFYDLNDMVRDDVPQAGSLFELYNKWGIISDNEMNGGGSAALRAGLMYDTRDVESNPTKGMWIEGHYILSPNFFGNHGFSLSHQLNITFRHYVRLVRDKFLFAYRLNYQGHYGNTPWYNLANYTVVGPKFDFPGIGGYRTVRGIMMNRVVGKQHAFANLELRWRFVDFVLWRQNISFALTGFADGAMVLQGIDLDNKTGYRPDLYEKYILNRKDGLHVAAGAGLRFIMNSNFIVAFEYAQCTNRQDGRGAFYVNTGFLF